MSTKETSFALVDKRGFFVGGDGEIRPRFFAGELCTPNVAVNPCEKTEEFASVRTGSCTCHRHVRLHIRITHRRVCCKIRMSAKMCARFRRGGGSAPPGGATVYAQKMFGEFADCTNSPNIFAIHAACCCREGQGPPLRFRITHRFQKKSTPNGRVS